MDAPAYVHEAHALLATLATAAADVHLRTLVLKTKCSELERALQYVDSLHARRDALRDARQAQATQTDAQTQQVHESIEDAIQRARQIRDALAKKSASASSSSDSEHACDDVDEEDAPLARDAHLQTTPGTPRQQPIRLEYPRRMKALVTRLEDVTAASAQHESFRMTFCRKLTEHVALRPPLHDAHVQPASKVQVGFATQALRLEHAHKHLAAFLRERVDVASDKVAAALAPDATLATIFPVYTRLQQGTRMVKQLRQEALAFAARAPAPPLALSSAAVAHRDAMLKRLTKHPQRRQAGPSAVTNRNLVASSRESAAATDAHSAMLARLQRAWDASYGHSDATTTTARADTPAYDTAVREVVLTETSNLVLSLFKTVFVDDAGGEDPGPEQIKHMLLLIRFVDSVALANGRRMRSVVARTS